MTSLSTLSCSMTVVLLHALIVLFSFLYLYFFFFNDTATTEIYTLSLHDALPIYRHPRRLARRDAASRRVRPALSRGRSEEHTSELQSLRHLVCRLLLEKKKKKKTTIYKTTIHKPEHNKHLNNQTHSYKYIIVIYH